MRPYHARVALYRGLRLSEQQKQRTPQSRKGRRRFARILPRRMSGACAKQCVQLSTAIKRARAVRALPYTVD